MKRARGFTLIELLVAISILAIVAVLGWRGLDGIVRARVALTAQMETTRGMQLAFAQLQSDCEHMATLKMLPKREVVRFEDDRLTMVRQVFLENEPTRMQVVAYRVVGGVLTRRESAATRDLQQLDVLWTTALTDVDSGNAVTLQAGVAGMQVQVWQANWQSSVQPAASLALGGQLAGLKVALYVQGQEAPMIKAFLLGGI
jgi:general secretion pathway protein J